MPYSVLRIVLVLIALAFSLAFALPALAAPFLVTDPVDANADVCVFKASASAPEQVVPVVTVAGDRICKVDLASSATGANSATLRVRNSLWGVDSPAVPFVFTKPATLPAPGNSRIVPQ